MTVSFELYTLVNGRWQIYVRYEEGRREDAMTEAETLEKESHVERVRVVRDQYDSEMNVSTETVIYETVLAGDAQKKSTKEGKGRDGSSGGDVDLKRKGNKKASEPGQDRGADLDALRGKSRELREAAKAIAKKGKRALEIKAQRSHEPNAVAMTTSSTAATVTRARQLIGRRPNQEAFATGMVKLTVVICISSLVSLGVAVGVFYGLDAVHQSGVFSFQSSKTYWELVIASFLLTFASSFGLMIRKVSFGSSPHATAHAQSAQVAHELIQQIPQIVVAPTIAMPVDTEDASEAEEEIKPKQQEEKQKIVERTADGPQHLKDASGWLLSCVTAGLKTISTQMKSLDPFNRFGLTLFFAGAGDFVGTRYRCDQKQRSDMLTERMQLLGHDENTAFAFCANIDEYLMQPKYLKMYDLGRTAMKNFLDDQKADQKLEGALKDWNKPAGTAEEEAGSDFVVVLFTDIINSTAQTQEIGDEGAMEVVRAHNQIIRQALTMHKGTEVKHMGDGIMAVFQGVPNSVQAAIHMQKGIEAYCQTTTDRQFRCRIGINAGEPIRDGQDYFGTPVQLAARVMSKAESDEIAVSHIVQTMYSGKDISFKKVGEFDLKGFDEPMAIFHVVYRPEQAAAAE
jgi:adenylate cyclase